MDKYKFGNKLTEYRTQKGLTQNELGEILGVSNKAVSKWENGSAMPRLDMMTKITDYFGVSLDEFLDIPTKHSTTEQETEQKYQKLYNEKMKRRKILRALLFVVLPVFVITVVLIYIFGPPTIVKRAYNSLPDYAKRKPEAFQSYDLSFQENACAIKVGNVSLMLPEGFVLYKDYSSGEDNYDEKMYNAPDYSYLVDGETHSDLFTVCYSFEEEMEHYNYFLNGEGWAVENYGREIKTVYDLWWLFYNYDFSDIKLCDWKKAIMSQYILTIQGVAAPISDRIIEYDGENASGFIFLDSIEGTDNTYYTAELYSKNGENFHITLFDNNKDDPFGYEEFCKVLNSVGFAN